MEDSNIVLPPTTPAFVELSVKIYQQMLQNTTQLRPHVCSICNGYKSQGTFIKDHWHGGEFGKCYRANQYKVLKPKARTDDPIKDIFLEDGHHAEEVMIKLLSRSYNVWGRDCEIENVKNIPLSVGTEDVKVVCHPDLVVELEDKQKVLIEFKAVKDWFYKNVAEKRLLPKQYYGQVQCYLDALDIQYGLLFVKSRHTSEILMPFPIERNQKFIDDRFKYLAAIQYLVNNQQEQMVPREYTNPKCSECKFCDYRKECWE